jgi:hypothetical protein
VDWFIHLLDRFCGQPLTEFSSILLEEFLWRVVEKLVDISLVSFHTYLIGVRLIFHGLFSHLYC